MKKNTKIMSKIPQIIIILTNAAIGSYAIDQQNFFSASSAESLSNTGRLSQNHNFTAYDITTRQFGELEGFAYRPKDLQEVISEEQKEEKPKLKKNKKVHIPARFTSPNSKTLSYQQRAARYENRAKNKENIHNENGCSRFKTAKVSQKPLAKQQPQTYARILQPVEPTTTSQEKSNQQISFWFKVPFSDDFFTDLSYENHSSLGKLPEWNDVDSLL